MMCVYTMPLHWPCISTVYNSMYMCVYIYVCVYLHECASAVHSVCLLGRAGLLRKTAGGKMDGEYSGC